MGNVGIREVEGPSLWAGVVLAAGKGVRMASRTPKLLHRLCGVEMVLYPVKALREAGVERLLLVVSSTTEMHLRKLLGDAVEYVLQAKPEGTGHALSLAVPQLLNVSDHVVVINGDVPLVRGETLKAMMARHLETRAAVTFLTVQGPLSGLGRVVRDDGGRVLRIVEEAEAAGAERGIGECNAGVYCFQVGWLEENVGRLRRSASGEVYITDLVGMAVSQGGRVETCALDDPQEALGVNNRLELSRAEAVLRQRICERWMMVGVTIRDPARTYIEADVELGPDTVLEPGSMLLGSTRIGRNCIIGPNAVVRDSTVGDDCRVVSSSLEGATLEPGCDVGPYSHLRPGTYLERGVHVGTCAEVKESRIGRDTRVGHFSYIGDARLGANVNIGAGTVTCNFDGTRKNRTEIGDDAFIGSDTMLIAPVVVGAGAVTGAGAVVTRDVPQNSVVVGVPARVVKKERGKKSRG